VKSRIFQIQFLPELTVVAGANGAGKSTLTKLSSINVPLIDPDALARAISPENLESAALAAGRQAIELARLYIQSGSSFFKAIKRRFM
jgi:predicted ABC-type ATPase